MNPVARPPSLFEYALADFGSPGTAGFGDDMARNAPDFFEMLVRDFIELQGLKLPKHGPTAERLLSYEREAARRELNEEMARLHPRIPRPGRPPRSMAELGILTAANFQAGSPGVLQSARLTEAAARLGGGATRSRIAKAPDAFARRYYAGVRFWRRTLGPQCPATLLDPEAVNATLVNITHLFMARLDELEREYRDHTRTAADAAKARRIAGPIGAFSAR